MVEAYPIIVFTKQLEDRSRKIMEIIEGEDYQDGRLIAHSLYKYEVEDNVTAVSYTHLIFLTWMY